MKEYTIDKIVSVVLSYKQLKKMSLYATSKVGRDVRVVSHPSPDCYSSCDYRRNMYIQLGRQFYSNSFRDTKNVTPLELKDKYKQIAMVMYGAYYHELFHLLYTPFGLASELVKTCNYDFQSFVHQVSNILEDCTIEGTGINRFPFCEPYILAIREVFKQPDNLQLVSDAVTQEPDNPGTLLSYLLHFCRGTDVSQFPEYKLWKDNKEFIEWGAYKCINTIDPNTRAKRQVAYALELTKILDMKEPDKNNVENPDLSDIENASSGFNKSMSGKGSRALSRMGNLTKEDAQSASMKGKNSPEETDEDAMAPQKAEQATHEPCSPQENPCSNTDLTKEGITMMANDEPVSDEGHFADSLSHYVKTARYLPEYNMVVKKHEEQIRRVVAIIRKMYATNNLSWNHYRMKGKLDMSTIYKKGNYKIFKKKNAPSETADLVFEILVDNSGSMTGSKARLAGEALIIFCESLNRLHIPFSVDCFTEGNEAVTISLKDYEESYEKTKTNMTLMTEQFDCRELATWCGNVDEINLRFVADELALRKEKDKVLLVISDGATCGDWRTLKKVSENIEKSGVTMLGIGIYDDNVSRIYNNSVIISNPSDLEGLGDFLNKYLISKIFKR